MGVAHNTTQRDRHMQQDDDIKDGETMADYIERIAHQRRGLDERGGNIEPADPVMPARRRKVIASSSSSVASDVTMQPTASRKDDGLPEREPGEKMVSYVDRVTRGAGEDPIRGGRLV